MTKLAVELRDLLARRITQQNAEMRASRQRANRECSRKVARLAKQRILTAADLIAQLPYLSPAMKRSGVELISLFGIRQAVPVLLELLSDPAMRLSCADALCWLTPGKKVRRFFVETGRRALLSDEPDGDWLEAVIIGLGNDTNDPCVVELLVRIFERIDLPGWIRGNAGDKLGCSDTITDHRTHLFRRCRDAALLGLRDDSIEVQFWSMYLIGQLCSGKCSRRRSSLSGLDAALPTLRKHAAQDHRIAPGYWWPMSAEAADVINCIETGKWPDPDAGERCARKT